MSENNKANENPETKNNTQDEAKQPSQAKNRSGIQKPLLYIAIGILIGVLVAQKATDFLPSILPILMAVAIVFFIFVTIAILVLPRIFNYLVKRYTGKDVDVEGALVDIQNKTNHVADVITAVALSKTEINTGSQKNIRKDIPDILHYLIFSRLRNTGLRFLITVFFAIGGFMGTILLYNQNQLLQKQNDKIEIQSSLMESERRGSQVELMGNVLADLTAEVKEAGEKGRYRYKLSMPLIGRIAATSQGFQPYKFLQQGTLTDREYSIERGQLLLALVNSQIDSLSMDRIYRNSNFASAYLRKFNFLFKNLCGAHLSGADLSGANLSYADLSNADLSGANLSSADLSSADLSGADLSGANLSSADLGRAGFFAANLTGADLTGADFYKVDLRGADLSYANLSQGKGLNVEILKPCMNIHLVIGLPDSLAIIFVVEGDLY